MCVSTEKQKTRAHIISNLIKQSYILYFVHLNDGCRRGNQDDIKITSKQVSLLKIYKK